MSTTRAVQALERILEEPGEPDDVLRTAVAVLAAEPGIRWAAIAFLEEGELVLGPQSGAPDEERRRRVSIAYQDDPVGELLVDGDVDRALLERVAALLAPYVLIGWDTFGETWEP